MYAIIQNNKIISYGENNMTQEGAETIQVNFTQEDIEKINDGYDFDIETGEFSENKETLKNQKEKIISEYQAKMLEIQNTQSELNIAIEGIEDEDEYIKQMSTVRKGILEARTHTLKQGLKAIAQEGVAKFGNEIIGEL